MSQITYRFDGPDAHLLQSAAPQGLTQMPGTDRSAFDELVRASSARMFAVAHRFLRCEEDAADAVQDALISAFQSLDSFKGNSQASTWLHRILVNACQMKLRSRARKRELRYEDSNMPEGASSIATATNPEAHDGYAHAVLSELKQHIRECIDQLPDSYKIVVLLRDIEGYDTLETARMLNESCPNVKTRLHRARRALKAQIKFYS